MSTRQEIYIDQGFLDWEYGVLQGSLAMTLIWKVFCISTIRLKDEVNFLIREFLEVHYFPSALLGMIYCLKKDFSFEKFQF